MKTNFSQVKFFLTLFLVASIVILFTGCSFYGHFFLVSNKTESSILRLKFKKEISKSIEDKRTLKLLYSDSLLKINDNVFRDLVKQLDFKQTDSFSIQLVIPAKSTILIGGALNNVSLLDSVFFKKDDIFIGFDIVEIYKKSKKTGGLFPPFYETYKLE